MLHCRAETDHDQTQTVSVIGAAKIVENFKYVDFGHFAIFSGFLPVLQTFIA